MEEVLEEVLEEDLEVVSEATILDRGEDLVRIVNPIRPEQILDDNHYLCPFRRIHVIPITET